MRSSELVIAACLDLEAGAVCDVKGDISITFVLMARPNLLVVDKLDKCGFAHLSIQGCFEANVWKLNNAIA